MKTYTIEELNAILEKHREWIISKGKKGQCANLSDADLRYANLSRADLRYANLSCADLRYADLSYANLSRVNLSATNLCFCKIYNTKGELISVSNQGKFARSITLNKNTKKAFIGCFIGSFEEARKIILDTYGDQATDINGGYGLTLLIMDSIEKQND